MRYRITNRNPLSKNPRVRKYLGTVIVTRYEIAFALKLSSTCTKYYSQYPIKTKGSFIIVDFYIPSCKLVFEIDGGYHKRQVKKDIARDKFLETKGIKVIRFRNAEIELLEPGYLINILIRYKKSKKQKKLLTFKK